MSNTFHNRIIRPQFAENQKIPTLILVVDDVEANCMMLCDLITTFGYQAISAKTGEEALQLLELKPQIDLVLLDYMMPGLSGYEVLQRIPSAVKTPPYPPVIMVSANTTLEATISCLEKGAKDYIQKPIQSALLHTRIKNCLAERKMERIKLQHEMFIEHQNQLLEKRVRDQVSEITRAQMATIFALSRLAESRDPETGNHLERIARYCSLLCHQLDKAGEFNGAITPDFQNTLEMASPLHDIGKVGVPDSVLMKPGKLTHEEFEIMKHHTLLGAVTLEKVNQEHPGSNYVMMGIEIARSHHERWDGKGYPDGIAGEQIPLSARILSVADVYDALASKRCYKDAFSHEKCCQILQEGNGTQFDSRILKAFTQCHQEFRETAIMYKSGLTA